MREAGAIGAAAEALEARGMTYEHDGAVWFRAGNLGDDKDRVLIRSTGESTYLASDAAYLLDKASRGFDILVYLWGADHHGTVARLQAAARALEVPAEVEVRIVQIVTLLRSGTVVKASKRAGVLVPLDDLLDEVGSDAVRFTFLTRSMDAPLDFDLELAKAQAPENPVYYVQYAHARISSILRRAAERPIEPDPQVLELLAHPSEHALMRKLSSFEEVVPEAARMRAPQKIAHFAQELASDFSAFYRDCQVISEDRELTRSRLVLCVAARNVIAAALMLLGVGTPERM
jgi:arginyl-tRNA synthetase